MTTALQRFANIRREEIAPVLASTFFFFCILTALMVMRPARDALGMQAGMDAIRWLFIGTAVVTLLANPVFGLLVSRFRRLVFITATYAFFAASLVGFWALLADRFSLEQSKRLFGILAVGGTTGAIFGPWLASLLAEPLGTASLLLVAVAFLGLAVVAAWVVAYLQPERKSARAYAAAADTDEDDEERAPAVDERAVIGGSAWEGFRRALRHPYLLGIACYVLILTILATFLYFTRLQMVAALGDDLDVRTAWLGRIDFYTQSTTLVLQLLVTAHIMKRLGVHVALVLLPVVVALGFIGLAIAGSLAALIVFDASFRGLQRAITRPARETLFTVVGREDKYKSKAFIDTFVYRGGDVMGAWTGGLLGRLGFALVGLAALAVPLALVWAGLGLWLGLTQRRIARHRDQAGAPAPAVAATSF